MESSSRSQRGRRQVVSTYLATLAMMVGRLLVYKWSPEVLDEENFALYIIGLRGLSLGYLAIGPALVAGLTYQVARAGVEEDELDGPYLLSSYLLAFLLFVPLTLLVWLAPESCARLVLGGSEYAALMAPLLLSLAGQYVAVIALAFLLGKTMVVLSNLVGVVSGCVIPVVCLLLFADSAQAVFWAMGWGTLLFGLVANLAVLALSVQTLKASAQALRRHAGRLYAYSLPRLPAAAGVAFLLAQPMLIPVHRTEDLTVAAIFAAGGTLIGMASSLIQPLALVLLPHAAQMVAQGEHQKVRQGSTRMLKGLTVLSLLATVLAAVATRPVLRLWLGEPAVAYAGFWIGLLPAMLPIAVYRAFSSIVNAADSRAHDSHNVGISVLVFGALYLALGGLSWEYQLLVSFHLAVYLLAGLTLYRSYQLLARRDG